MKPVFLVGATLLSAVMTCAQPSFSVPFVTVEKNHCVISARAYTVPEEKPRYASRFDLFVGPAKGFPAQWEFTLPGQEEYPANNTNANFSPLPFNNQKRTTIRATLHRFDTYDERITFKNLPLAPLPTKVMGKVSPARHLELQQSVSQTTPSGITVSLPIQSVDAIPMNWNGNMDAVFIKINASPSTQLSRLPKSPLFQKYGHPVQIKFDVAEPNGMSTYLADNTYPLIAVGIPNLKTATTMDLTLIVRQKVELETFPVALDVPVERPAKNLK
jgi:hypothetical protein